MTGSSKELGRGERGREREGETERRREREGETERGRERRRRRTSGTDAPLSPAVCTVSVFAERAA